MPVFEEEHKCEEFEQWWIFTYGDLMTLLLVFFILLFSFCKTDVEKFKSVGAKKSVDIVKERRITEHRHKGHLAANCQNMLGERSDRPLQSEQFRPFGVQFKKMDFFPIE